VYRAHNALNPSTSIDDFAIHLGKCTCWCQSQVEAAHFHDHRLGRALDALWTAGLDRLSGAVISQAIQRYALEVTRLHTDATSLKVDGAYEREVEEEGPLVTLGTARPRS
jgi:hypothetical protein